MIVPFDDLELVYQSLRTLELPHTHKFPRVNAQDSKLGPIQPWDVKDFLRPGRGRASTEGRAGGRYRKVDLDQRPSEAALVWCFRRSLRPVSGERAMAEETIKFPGKAEEDKIS